MWLHVQAEFVANFMGQLGRRMLSSQLPLQVLYVGDILFCGLVRMQARCFLRLQRARHRRSGVEVMPA